jgi:two-component system NarL family sensor kinase
MPFFINSKKLEEEIAKRVTESCDEIISEMGAEIHDDLIQKLSIFRLYINQIELSAKDPAEIQNIAFKMASDFERVVVSVRSISQRLLPTYFTGESLMDRLISLCKNMEQPGVGHIHFVAEGSLIFLENIVQVHLLRIVQELIHNSIKHSSAWHVWVRLKSGEEHITIEVEDDGVANVKIDDSINRLKRRNNTLKLRVRSIGASIEYLQGSRGLLARVTLKKS